MIQEFSVENYRSIKTKQTMNFLANNKLHTGSDDYLSTQVNDSVRLLKLCILYGYNASGKSNLLQALDFLRNLALSGPDTKDEETGFVPFLLDEETQKQKGTFSLVFYIDSIRYEYSISLDDKIIHYESLRYSPEGRIATLFSRSYDQKLKTSKLSIGAKSMLSSKEKTILHGNTIENTTVLFAYQKSNIHSPSLDAVVRYFKADLLPLITPKVLLRNWSINRLTNNAKRKQFYVSFLEKADFQISDLEIRNNTISVDEDMLNNLLEQGAPKGLIEQLSKEKQFESNELHFLHKTSKGVHPIVAEEESQGTLRYFGLGGVLHELISSSHSVAIDELESSLHPDLVTFFLQMFLLNAPNSQILASTHAPYIMEQDYMRNDMIWFCEKDENGASEYYSAQAFSLHKNIKVSNFYRAGKLGAKPILGNPFIGKDEQ
ncbi:AAA family ATPase [Sphaerochaeta sp.]|uniref:AAA family ATPase n=1 Tax=Sphaerochaeta sp. TaxID=1972642 RepID=UPI002FC8F3F6